jgi:hypothetical protein
MSGISTFSNIADSASVSITTGGTLFVNHAIDTLAGSSSNAGAVTLNSSGSIVLAGLGNITSDGAVQITAASGIQTEADITTTNDNVRFVSTTTLTGAVAIDTGSGVGAIAFNAAVNGSQNLMLTAGTGNVEFDAAVGSSTRLGILTIVSAANVTATSVLNAASIVQQSGSGTTTFTGAVNTDTATGVDLTGTNLVVTAGITTTGNGVLTTNLLGSATLATGSISNIAGSTTLTADGAIVVGGSVMTAGLVLLKSDQDSIIINPAALVTSSTQNVTLEAEDNVLVSPTAMVTTVLGEIILRSGLNDTDSSGGMTLNGTIQALAAGQCITLDLNQQQGATQSSSGALISSNLRLISTGNFAGAFSLGTTTLNNVDTLVAQTSGAVTFKDLDTLTVGSVGSSSGIAAMSGISTFSNIADSASVSITTGGTLFVNQAIDTLAGSSSNASHRMEQ